MQVSKVNPVSFKVVIPTRDSAQRVGLFLDAYRKLGVEPLYIVDSRSKDATLDALIKKSASLVLFTPSADFAEAGMIEFGSKAAGTPWVLRMDDDEFPSKALIQWAETTGVASLNQASFLSRRELFLKDEEIFYSRGPGIYTSPHRPGYLGPQCRLHHVDRVRYVYRIHTPGFENPHFFSFAPEEAFFIHCNCLLRTPVERLEKMRFYAAIENVPSWRFAEGCLPELFSLSVLAAATDGLEEFRDLFSSLPIKRNCPTPEIAEEDREILTREVGRFRALNQANRAKGDVPYISGDDLRWLHHFPKVIWKPLSEFLCKFGRGGVKDLGVAIWNYQNIFN